MTKKNSDNPFGDFSGTAIGEAEQDKWSYPGIGYNASSGIFFINEDQVAELTLTPLALRQSKEVEDINGVTHRYPVNYQKAKMASGDVTYRLQVACIVNDEIFVFGARSWTARASWLNPRSGQYRDDKFDTGIWYQLDDWIKEQKSKHGIPTTPLCWQLNLVTSDKQLTVGTGKNTSKSTPIQFAGEPVFVGPELVKKYEELYQEEDLAGWIAEWKKTTTEEATVEDEPVALEEDELPEGIPF